MNFRLPVKLGPKIGNGHLLVTEPNQRIPVDHFSEDSLLDSIRLAKLRLLSIGPIYWVNLWCLWSLVEISEYSQWVGLLPFTSVPPDNAQESSNNHRSQVTTTVLGKTLVYSYLKKKLKERGGEKKLLFTYMKW